MGLEDINNQGFPKIKPPPPTGYYNLVKIVQGITKPKQALMPHSFFTIALRNFPVSTHIPRASWRLKYIYP